MLKEIKINNLAIVDEVQIKFGPSFNVITGSSGSGKTIIYKSINYLFGEKFNKNDIRRDEEKCEILGVLLINSKEHIIKRVFTKIRTENFINNKKVNVKDYISFTASSWESYGQHEQQKLLDEQNHLSYLDLFAGNEPDMQKYENLFINYIKTKKEIDEFIDSCNEYKKNKELYIYQFEELNDFELKINEDLEIKSRIDNINKLKDVYESILLLTNLDSGIKVAIRSFIDKTSDSTDDERDISDLNIRLNRLLVEISDIEYQSSLLGNNFYYDHQELEILEDRLLKINELKRKYGGTIESAIQYKHKLSDLINNSTDIEEKISDMNNDREGYKTELTVLANKIYNKRVLSAEKLESNIINDLKSMDMDSVNFTVALGDVALNERAIDKCEFHIRTNKGESTKSIGKIVSGGELSRIMMSIKLSLNSKSKEKIFLLDEIDSGLSGTEADSLGNVIKRLSNNNQIVCITHLSQIASKASTHIKTSKSVIHNRTICDVEILNKEDSIKELATMISGKNITEGSIEYAKGISKI